MHKAMSRDSPEKGIRNIEQGTRKGMAVRLFPFLFLFSSVYTASPATHQAMSRDSPEKEKNENDAESFPFFFGKLEIFIIFDV